jgi:hypothetical protein
MEDVVVVAAVALAAQATALAAKHVQDNENNKVKQRRTVTTLRFDAMLQSAVYSVWFETNLRCTRSTFFKLASFLRDQGIGFAHAMVKRHSYEKKLAAALYFFRLFGGLSRSRGGYGYESRIFDGDRNGSCPSFDQGVEPYHRIPIYNEGIASG